MRRLTGILIVSLALGTLPGGPVAAQSAAAEDSAKAATVRHLLQQTNAAQLMVSGMETILPAQRAANPQVPAAFWDAFMARVRRDLPALIDSLVPVYTSRFSQAELDDLVRFYDSPTGQHLAKEQVTMVQESSAIGQRWGALIGRQVADSLQLVPR